MYVNMYVRMHKRNLTSKTQGEGAKSTVGIRNFTK